MKFNIKQYVYSLGIIGLMLMASNVYSQPRDRDLQGHGVKREKMKGQTPGDGVKRDKGEDRMLAVFKQLDLSPEQEKQLEAYREKHREQKKNIHESIRAKKEEMKIELQMQELNMDNVNKINSELKSIASKKIDHRLEGILEVRNILTPEQFAKYMKLKNEFCHTKKEWK